MHNWPDSQCKIILGHLADAMAPDSRLLIGEMVVPERADTGTDPTPYWMDMAMLMIGGRERSEKEFSAVLDDVGLQLIKVWKAKVGVQSVLEVKLKGK